MTDTHTPSQHLRFSSYESLNNMKKITWLAYL